MQKNVQEVLALLPQDGSEMDYAELERKAVAAPIDNPREALRYIIKHNLIAKRLSGEFTPVIKGPKPVRQVLVKLLPPTS